MGKPPGKRRGGLSQTAERDVTPPPEERCGRSDGKSWQCRGWKLSDKSLCKEHWEQARRRASGKPGAANGRIRKKRRRGRGRPARARVAEEEEARRGGAPREMHFDQAKRRAGKRGLTNGLFRKKRVGEISKTESTDTPPRKELSPSYAGATAGSTSVLPSEGGIETGVLVPHLPIELCVCTVNMSMTDVVVVTEDLPIGPWSTEGEQPYIPVSDMPLTGDDVGVRQAPLVASVEDGDAENGNMVTSSQPAELGASAVEATCVASFEPADVLPVGAEDFPPLDIEWPSGTQTATTVTTEAFTMPLLAALEGLFRKDPLPSVEEMRLPLEQSTRGWHAFGFPQDIWMTKMTSLWEEFGRQHARATRKRQSEEVLQKARADLQNMRTAQADVRTRAKTARTRMHELQHELETSAQQLKAFDAELKYFDQKISQGEAHVADLEKSIA